MASNGFPLVPPRGVPVLAPILGWTGETPPATLPDENGAQRVAHEASAELGHA